MIELSDEQQAAVALVREWFTGRETAFDVPRPFRLFGPAGTGKTTLAKHLGPALGASIAFAAYTGKAAHVLRSKGVPATTIHSAIYRPAGNKELMAERDRLQDMRDRLVDEPAMGEHAHADYSQDIAEIDSRLAEIEAEMRVATGWKLRDPYDCEWSPQYTDLIVLDECSMVDAKMAADIESFGTPVLVLGDPFQLPPIGGAGHYTSGDPDVLLDHIHRQALESPVLRLATDIRTTALPEVTETASVSAMLAADQVICWRNETRWKINRVLRKKLGRPEGRPVEGDRVMCLTNNRDIGILNGQQFDVHEVKPAYDGDAWALMVRECGEPETAPVREILAWADGFRDWNGEQGLKVRRAFRGKVGAFTFANAITAHKAQGSEWESVYIIDETPAMRAMEARKQGAAAADLLARRWAYTATTRARESVTLARLKG